MMIKTYLKVRTWTWTWTREFESELDRVVGVSDEEVKISMIRDIGPLLSGRTSSVAVVIGVAIVIVVVTVNIHVEC
jgi:hypothetical protein